MKCRDISLSEKPFDFDISWPFPAQERNILLNAIKSIKISSPKNINKLESLLAKIISKNGYVWDETSREKCTLWRPDFRMSVDFYNEEKKIAIEVEKTEVKRIIHDFLKLTNGSLTFVPKVRYGVIIHPMKYKRTSGKESVFASRVIKEIQFYFKRLIAQTSLNDVLFLMYDFE